MERKRFLAAGNTKKRDDATQKFRIRKKSFDYSSMLLPQKSRRHFFFHYKEIYPYNISIESSRKVKRAKKKFNRGIIS